MLIPIHFNGVYAEGVKIESIYTEADAAKAGIDLDWLKRENLNGRIMVSKDTTLLEFHDRVIGMAVQHDKFKDKLIRTSPIEMIVHTLGDFPRMTIVFTRNSRYEVLA